MFLPNALVILELFSVFIASVLFLYYLYHKKCYTYWQKRNLPVLQPQFPVGNLGLAALGKQSMFLRIEQLYHELKNEGYRHAGLYFFNGPIYFPIHPDFVKRVLATDFEYFIDRGMYENPQELPLSSHIFSMKGEQWKDIRVKLSPTFTSGKMKSMYNIVVKNSENLVRKLESLAAESREVDVKDILRRYTCDVVGSSSFGIDCNTIDHPESEFNEMVKRIFKQSSWQLIKLAFEEGLQNPGNILKISHSDPIVQEYFTNLVRETVQYRDSNKVQRDDFLNILIQLRDNAGMSFEEIVAQSYLFFTAGFETSSLTLSYCIHELAHNQKVQEQIRKEIRENLGQDASKYTYDEIMTLPCLDKTIKETLRKYPPAAMLNRMCVKDYQVPGTETVIEKGTPVIVPLLGLQRDPEFFPDPLEFDPERFNGEHTIVPYTYGPFGLGPRKCIGLRFGYMQTKLGLATLLNNFRFLPSSKSPRHLVASPETTTIAFNVIGGVWTTIEKV